jgi:hypothetical protein
MIDAYPLQWPEGFPITKSPEQSRFGRYDWRNRKNSLTLHKARQEVYEQVRLLTGKRELENTDCIISTNMKTRKTDGEVYANAREPEDSGVAVYFQYNGSQRVLACDRWLTVKENLHAIALTLDAMRGCDRWGVSDMLERLFTGFIGIPEDAGKSWQSILDIDSCATRDDVRRAYREKMKQAHPDAGGNDEYAAIVNQAYRQALIEVEASNE